ncbi:MAG: E3 binding domain-containing protein, partial [Cyclobacteriaceae bacterium]|nr:E3 binding domain-containing protein [Cyclobacteriaceae bacterium]
MIKFLMPSLGADMEDGTLVEWRKQPGDILQRGDIIADVDTQKGLIEIEVFDEGILEKQVVKEGEKVPVGTVLALIKPLGDSSKSPLPEAFKSSEPVFASSDVIQENKPELREEKTTKEQRIKISPLARKMAEENHLDISMIKGTGPEESIVKVDI